MRAALFAALLATAAALASAVPAVAEEKPVTRIGILHSLYGTVAIPESSL